jgi:hypothetical protein
MRSDCPTKAEVDYLVRERKFIREIPKIVEGKTEFRMQAVVYRKSAPRKATGLVIMARAKKSPPGVPRPFPSSALVMTGRFRVRGLNHELWHDNPDTTIVKGWHEHVWMNEFEDRFVVSARPKPKDLTILGMFEWGLRKWNIAVERSQLKVQSHGSKK